MLIKKELIEKIKEIIERGHASFLISMVGRRALTRDQIRRLEALGVDASNADSIIETIYHHNYLNEHGQEEAPKNLDEITEQQKGVIAPSEEEHEASKEHLNSNLAQLIQKQNQEVVSKVEGLIRETNNQFKFGKVADLREHTKDMSVATLKGKLRDISKDASRNWSRIANTEISNAVSLGSVDRIVDDNKNRDMNEVYVYRIVVNDAALCKYCRKFYLDKDGSPKLYRMSTILANGSNYGKKAKDWLPVATATHPNERCSQLIELKRGWKLLPGGGTTFIGPDKWDEYIQGKLQK